MRTRLVATAVAITLALLGTIVLLSYVRDTEAKAVEPVATLNVMVAVAAIPAGTPVTSLPEYLEIRTLPEVAVLADRVLDLGDLDGQVTTVPIEPGEQLLYAKFGAPTAGLVLPDTEVPDHLQQVTVLLEPERAVGGRLVAGDTVGVLISHEGRTAFELHKVLLTDVREFKSDVGEEAAGVNTDATSSWLVTFAVDAASAAEIVFGAENGSLWLSKEPLAADENAPAVLDGSTVLG